MMEIKPRFNELAFFRKCGSTYPMFSEDLAGHIRSSPKIGIVLSDGYTSSPYCFPWIPFNISYENFAMDRCRFESHKCGVSIGLLNNNLSLSTRFIGL